MVAVKHEKEINGVQVVFDFPAKEAQLKEHLEETAKHAGCKVSELASVTLTMQENGDIDVDYTLVPRKFERIRRITGYLVGTVDRWNNAKRSELNDRVKHAQGE